MLTAIDLDDQHHLKADEVGDIVADRVLTAELHAIDLTMAQPLPMELFGLGRSAPQSAGAHEIVVAWNHVVMMRAHIYIVYQL